MIVKYHCHISLIFRFLYTVSNNAGQSLFSNVEMQIRCVHTRTEILMVEERALRRHSEVYPNRRMPDFKIFKNLYSRLAHIDTFRHNWNDTGHPKTLTSEQELYLEF